jgi:hypothetical protein
MTRVLLWIAGYVTALGWGAAGMWIHGTVDPVRPWWLLLLLGWVALPAIGSLAARRSRRRLRHPLLGGLAFGGVVATAYLLLVGVLVASFAGLLVFGPVLMHPIGTALFFAVPPAYFGWLCLVHKAVVQSEPASRN